MLYEIVKAAHDHPAWRSALLPLVKLAKLEENLRVASGVLPLRDAAIRTAFETTDADLRRALVEIVQHHDAKAATSTTWLSPRERTALVRVAYTTTNADRRRRILALLREAKYSPSFLKFVDTKKFPNPNPEGREAHPEVKFFSLSPAEQKRVYEEWKTDRKENAQKHKPEGLSKDTKLTPEKFDALEVGDILWISYNPKKLHKVTGFNKTKGNKPVLEMVQIDRDDPEKEGEKRYLHRSGVENPDHEFHVVPKAGEEKLDEEKDDSPESSPKFSDPPKELRDDVNRMIKNVYGDDDDVVWKDEKSPFPKGTKIKLEHGVNNHTDVEVAYDGVLGYGSGDVADDYVLVRHKGEYRLVPVSTMKAKGKEQGKGEEKSEAPKAEKPKSEEKSEPKAEKLKVTHAEIDDFNVGDVFFEEGFPDSPIKIKKIVEKNGDFHAFVAEGGVHYYKDEIHKEDDGYLRVPRDADKPAKDSEKAEAPKVEGKHKDRKELLGKKPGVSKTTKMKLSDDVVELAAPEGMDAEAAEQHRKRMRDLDVADARDLIARLKLAVDAPEGKRMKALESSGYTHEGVKKLHDAVEKKLRTIADHVYGKEVLAVANKYDLEAEDADDLREFKSDKPGGGLKLPDAQLMQKFLQKAKPETRERMQGMSIADFMAMYKAIMAEEDAGAE
jgi:hypothetical protein